MSGNWNFVDTASRGQNQMDGLIEIRVQIEVLVCRVSPIPA